LAGDVQGVGGRQMLEDIPANSILMPSADGWIEAARDIYGKRLISFPRYSFSTEKLNSEQIEEFLLHSPHTSEIKPLDRETATRVLSTPDHFIDITEFQSADDFASRGVGYCIFENGEPIACAFSSLVCSRQVELSLFVQPEYRRKGIATALSCAIIRHCLKQGLDPHWDAANPESYRLALKLGYVFTEMYEAHFLSE
jgi:GNAT superfamily N-acetyltransferase